MPLLDKPEYPVIAIYQTVRIHQAKKMLEKGLSLKDAALAPVLVSESLPIF